MNHKKNKFHLFKNVSQIKNTFKARKKGSILLEFLGLVPIFFLIAWGIMQVVFYLSALSLMHQAADESARFLTMEFRGLPAGPVDVSYQSSVKSRLFFKVDSMTQNNKLILLFHDESSHDTSSSIDYVWENKSTCDNYLGSTTHTRVICVYTDQTPIVSSSAQAWSRNVPEEEIKVELKAPFNFVGSFIPNLKYSFFLYGEGVSQKEISSRFQY